MRQLNLAFDLGFDCRLENIGALPFGEVRVCLSPQVLPHQRAALAAHLTHIVAAAQRGMGGSESVQPRWVLAQAMNPQAVFHENRELVVTAALEPLDTRFSSIVWHVLHVARCDGVDICSALLRLPLHDRHSESIKPVVAAISDLPKMWAPQPFHLECTLDDGAESRAITVAFAQVPEADEVETLMQTYLLWRAVCIAGGFISQDYPPAQYMFIGDTPRQRGRFWHCELSLPRIDNRAFYVFVNMLSGFALRSRIVDVEIF